MMLRGSEQGIGGVAFPRPSATPVQTTPSRQGPETGADLIESLAWRATDILWLLDSRLSIGEIAAVLQISSGTVQRQTRGIYRKLRVRTRR